MHLSNIIEQSIKKWYEWFGRGVDPGGGGQVAPPPMKILGGGKHIVLPPPPNNFANHNI